MVLLYFTSIHLSHNSLNLFWVWRHATILSKDFIEVIDFFGAFLFLLGTLALGAEELSSVVEQEGGSEECRG
jgi:hypothetical protein